MKKILFIIDKVELKYFEFNKLVTNFWIIKEMLERNCEVYISTISKLSLRADVAYTNCFKTFLSNGNIFYNNISFDLKIDDFELVMFRPDPPVDIDYINATYIFDFVKNPKVINSPRIIRDFNEKLHSVYFKDYMTDNIVTASIDDIERFLSVHKKIVLKPLNRCFGAGVMFLYEGDPNTRTIINTMTNSSNTLVMVQEFIPQVTSGDMRVLTLGDRVLDYAVKKLPSKDDFKFNTHSDDFIKKAELSYDEKIKFTDVAKRLNALGISMAGLDVIDGKIIEINVTSPCYFINEVNNLFNVHLEKEICDFLLTGALLSV